MERKPHPLPLLHAAALAEVSPGECIYGGDGYLNRPLDLLDWLKASGRQ